MNCTLYNDTIRYDAPIGYDGVCVTSNCTFYNDPILYNAAIPYNGICVSPIPPAPIHIGGGASGVHRVLKRRKPKELDDEAIALMLLLLEDE